MALSGIDIFKMLPKTNCQECGVPTCMAFAMKLAGGQAELDACPYVTDEAKEKLEEASAPPLSIDPPPQIKAPEGIPGHSATAHNVTAAGTFRRSI